MVGQLFIFGVAPHGKNLKENTHPFVVGDWFFIHNGIWSEHELVRLAISNQVTMEGDTDSEVAAHFWNIIGPKKFAEKVDFSGVFMGLHRSVPTVGCQDKWRFGNKGFETQSNSVGF